MHAVLGRRSPQFFPVSFKNLKRQRLYIFRSRQSVDRSAWKIKPAAFCDEQHIIQFWDDILRFMATIKLKETTASDIFRRLNSYSKQHGLYQTDSNIMAKLLKIAKTKAVPPAKPVSSQ